MSANTMKAKEPKLAPPESRPQKSKPLDFQPPESKRPASKPLESNPRKTKPPESQPPPAKPKAFRDHLRLVFAGHVDHGKSTVIGRLLFDTGSLPQGAVDKIRAISKETGQPFELAHLLDAFEEERKQGITIDTTRLRFSTSLRDYVIIDAPGHKEFLKNMISGAADAQAAFLVVDAERGVEEQSKRHARMLSLMGVTKVGLAVNKMDLVSFSQSAFKAVKSEMEAFLSSLGLTPFASIPLSAFLGDNVAEKSANMPWYRGPSLIEALDSLPAPGAPSSGPFRLPIQDVYKFDDRRILAGRIESGEIRVGEAIAIYPGGRETTVKRLAAWLPRDEGEAAFAGQSVGVMVADEFFNKRGEIVAAKSDPPVTAEKLIASIFWLGKSPLSVSKRYKLRLASSESEAEIAAIRRLMDSESLDGQGPQDGQGAQDGQGLQGAARNGAEARRSESRERGENRRGSRESLAYGRQAHAAKAPPGPISEVGPSQAAEVEIRLSRPLAVDLFSRCQATGRFVLMEGFDVAGGGIVTGALTAGPAARGFVCGDLKGRCEVFEEYVYDVRGMTIHKLGPEEPFFSPGDPVPLKGASYLYPESFDIVIFRDKVAVLIRKGLFSELKPLSSYEFGGGPLVNGRGFGIKAYTKSDWLKIKSDYEGLTPDNEVELAERWLDFNAFRFIPMGAGEGI